MNLRIRDKEQKEPTSGYTSSLIIDLRNAINSPETNNFTVMLMRLMLKADRSNFAKLASAYPQEAIIVDRYKSGIIGSTIF